MSSKILTCRPGSNPLGGLRGGPLAKKSIFSQYGICSNMVANNLPENTPSTLASSYIKSRFRYISTPRKI